MQVLHVINLSQFRDPNFTSKEDDDKDNGFDFGLDNIDYDNMNFYEMEMYPSSMYDPEEGPDERWVICPNIKVDTAISASSTMKRWRQWWKVFQSFEPPPRESQPHLEPPPSKNQLSFEPPPSKSQLSFEPPPRGSQLFCRIWSLRRDGRGDLCTPQAR